MEITKGMTVRLTHVVNGGCLVKPLDWLAV